ncbi:MAG: hypothetical protein CMJ74_08785 [Planctomycetaceae bacterium]|nr:hypothetical protein [Planctomycetaceae bacterium]|tara:strand:- start:111 stop:368 length:258 start_codon:yes stop_codon:yes gene_type:complete
MATKAKLRRFFALIRDHMLYLAIGTPAIFLLAFVYLILDGKSFLIAVLGAMIFVAIIAYVGSLFTLGVIVFSEEPSTHRNRRRRQ